MGPWKAVMCTAVAEIATCKVRHCILVHAEMKLQRWVLKGI